MKKLAIFALLLCVALPLVAAEKKSSSDVPVMAPPEPLADGWSKWLVGDWEGWAEGPYGKSTERLSVRMGLDGQFLLMEAKSDGEQMKYSGMGAVTTNPKTGEHVGYWIDSFRGMYEGKGKLEGNKETMEWSGPMGTATRVVEKVGDDKFVVTEKMAGPDGNAIEGKAEMTRVKKNY